MTSAPSPQAEDAVSGVYMLYRHRRLIYVGRSIDCHARIRSHRIAGRLFDYATVTPAPLEDLGWLEESLVAALGSNKALTENAAAAERPDAEARPMPRLRAPEPPTELTALSKDHAVIFARKLGLAVDLLTAWAEHSLPIFPKHPGRIGPGAPFLITHGDLLAWCEARQREKAAAA